MPEVELLVNAITLLIVGVILVFVGVAYVRTRMRRLLVLFLLAALVGINMVITTAEDVFDRTIPHIELLLSLLTLGIALLLLATVVRQFPWKSQ